jgi:hypothetical protein
VEEGPLAGLRGVFRGRWAQRARPHPAPFPGASQSGGSAREHAPARRRGGWNDSAPPRDARPGKAYPL